MIPITANARFSLPFAASSLYASLGTGVAPGDWDWDTENGSLVAVPLQVGRVDFAPVVVLVLVFLAAELAGRGLFFLYGRLPF